MPDPATKLESVASRLFSFLARSFPVCSASDEFYFFPQLKIRRAQLPGWDDFSPERVTELAGKLSGWEDELDRLSPAPLDPEVTIELDLLKHALRTLREEVAGVRFHQNQPTFYLTVTTIGLAEALETREPEVWERRVKGLPAFLDQSCGNLKRIPLLFRELGLEMVSGCRKWLKKLSETRPGLLPSLEALKRFEKNLRRIPTRNDFRLPEELFERIIRFHLRSGEGVKEVLLKIEEEIRITEETLKKEAGFLLPGSSWLKAFAGIPAPARPDDGLLGLFREETESLAGHCRKHGLITPELPRGGTLKVAPVPPYLSAVRTASSYSMPPGHPAGTGTFFVIQPEGGRARPEPVRDYRMLTAHETYPGHHLLDASRWNLKRPLRRHFESPLFYEGWACFAEELMARTGYFRGAADRLLLAKRRLWRALRGRVDLGLQTGEMNLITAAELLGRAGLSRKQALAAARKYTLRPGYQVCYTLGRNRFLELFGRYGQDDPARFVRTVLSQGEIGFADLEKVFKRQQE